MEPVEVVVDPLLHDVQDVWSASGWYVPMAHAYEPDELPKLPAADDVTGETRP